MRKKTIYIFLLALILAWATAGQAQDKTALTSIDVSDNAVLVKASGPFTYTVYKPSDPYTVVVELPNVGIGGIGPRMVPDKKGISEIRVIAPESPSLALKIEILLTSPADIEPSYSNNSLVLMVKEALEQPPKVTAKESGTVALTSEAGPASLSAATEIRDVTFDYEAKTGSLNLIIKADGAIVPAVFSLENKIVVDIPQVSIKAKLPEPVVSPVKGIRYGVHKDKGRIVIDLKRPAEFTATVTADSLVIAFRVTEMPEEIAQVMPKEAPPAEAIEEEKVLPAESKYEGKLISLDFQDSAIVPIFRLLGEIGRFNTVIHPGVSGNITLKLENVPWDQALDIVLETSGFEKSVEGNIMRIAPAGFFQKLKDEAERRREAGVRIEPLIEEFVPLNHAEATDIKTLIEAKKLLSPRGSVDIHPGENTIILRDTAEGIRGIKDFIAKVNTPVPQVMIEAKIVEIHDIDTLDLGVKWFTQSSGRTHLGQVTGDFSLNTPIITPASGLDLGGDDGLSGGGIGRISFGTADAIRVELGIEALERLQKAKTLSNPKVLTINKKEAKIRQGASIPVQTTTAEGSTTEFVDANLKLEVTPTIKGDYIQLKLVAGNDRPVGGGIDKQSVETQALVKDGETLVVGGIYVKSETTIEGGVPFLSKIPILGWLFKTRYTEDDTREVLIFITPTIVKQPML